MTNTYYTCEICDTLNSARRHSCQNCGTIPAKYSVLRKPSRLIEHDSRYQFIETLRAIGCAQAFPHHAKVGLRTVPAGYYATE